MITECAIVSQGENCCAATACRLLGKNIVVHTTVAAGLNSVESGAHAVDDAVRKCQQYRPENGTKAAARDLW